MTSGASAYCFPMMDLGDQSPNQPAAGKAGIALCLAFEHHSPGLPEPERWTEYVSQP